MYHQLSANEANTSSTLEDLSRIKSEELVPAIVYLCMLMIVGVTGNVCVLIIYYFRFRASTHRSFILVLAFYDFLACILGTPWAIAECFFAYNYMDEVSCKLFRFILYYTSIASSLTLVLISFERFRKICTPLKKQFTVPKAKRALFVVTGVISTLSASPAIIFYGNATIDTGIEGKSGVRCFITDFYEYDHPIWPMVFNVYLLILAFVSTLCMTVCYVLIAKQVSKMGTANLAKRMKASGKSNGESSSVFDGEELEESQSEIPPYLSNDKLSESTSIKSNTFVKGSMKDLNNATKLRTTVKERTSMWTSRLRKRISTSSGRKTLRITKMLTIVTAAFVISYLPHLTLMIWNMIINIGQYNQQSLPTDNVYKLLFYSFFVNNLVNPFVYAAMDLKFRGELKKLVKCEITHRR